jgi:hypothetical protein
MRLLTALLLSMASLSADTSDRLPNTKKMVPVRKHGAGRTLRPAAPGRDRTAKAAPKKPVQGGAVMRALSGTAPAAASQARTKATHTARAK